MLASGSVPDRKSRKRWRYESDELGRRGKRAQDVQRHPSPKAGREVQTPGRSAEETKPRKA